MSFFQRFVISNKICFHFENSTSNELICQPQLLIPFLCRPDISALSASNFGLVAQLRLNAEQNAQRQTVEAEIQELEEAVTLEDDASKKRELKEEISTKKNELVDLLDSFEVPILLRRPGTTSAPKAHVSIAGCIDLQSFHDEPAVREQDALC